MNNLIVRVAVEEVKEELQMAGILRRVLLMREAKLLKVKEEIHRLKHKNHNQNQVSPMEGVKIRMEIRKQRKLNRKKRK